MYSHTQKKITDKIHLIFVNEEFKEIITKPQVEYGMLSSTSRSLLLELPLCVKQQQKAWSINSLFVSVYRGKTNLYRGKKQNKTPPPISRRT